MVSIGLCLGLQKGSRSVAFSSDKCLEWNARDLHPLRTDERSPCQLDADDYKVSSYGRCGQIARSALGSARYQRPQGNQPVVAPNAACSGWGQSLVSELL